MHPQQILLIEDDPSIQRFVEFALEDLPVNLIVTDSVGGALAQLAKGPADLILTDLMLPGESGLDLIERLASQPHLKAQAKVVVFSAGLNPDLRAQLESLGVWRMMSKPVSVVDLIDCVQEGLKVSSTPNVQAQSQQTATGLTPEETQAVAEHFNGDLHFFMLYRKSCVEQFQRDIEKGDTMAAEQDLPGLRRLGHSLKTVLLTLAQDPASVQAKKLELAAEQGEPFETLEQWAELKKLLQKIPDIPSR
jgi:CheY-like chemotaxis protein